MAHIDTIKDLILDSAEAAKLKGWDESYIRKLCIDNRLPAVKKRKEWIIHLEDLNAYQSSHVGRPAKEH